MFFLCKRSGKKFYFDFHKLHNMTNVFVQNLCFYRARFSMQNLFKTTSCHLKRQGENRTGVPASDSSHEYTVDRRLSRGKSFLAVPQIDILEYRVSHGLVKPDPEHLHPLMELPVLQNHRELQRSLGMFDGSKTILVKRNPSPLAALPFLYRVKHWLCLKNCGQNFSKLFRLYR